MSNTPSPRLRLITQGGALLDIAVTVNGNEILLLGPAGARRELSFIPPEFTTGRLSAYLPVLLGSGLGHALDQCLAGAAASGAPLAVVDKELDILASTALRQKYAACPNILWVDSPTPGEALTVLSKWQLDNGRLPFLCLANPAYLRLDRDYYGAIRTKLEASAKANFWAKASYRKFSSPTPRILLITSGYFLIGDVQAACERMGIEYRLLNLPDGELAVSSFIEQLLSEVVNFKPDFVLTINHLGVDREGVLLDLLARVELPLASWFVDNPHLILYRYTNVVSPWTTIFTWDADNLDSLRALGFEQVHYLPLGTDHERFAPQTSETRTAFAGYGWQSRVSFVGNSMLHKVTGRLKASNPSAALRKSYPAIAAAFSESDERSVKKFIELHYPHLVSDFDALGDIERQLSYETLITWEATLQYRLSCVKATLPFEPLILGDNGWFDLLPTSPPWRYHKELSYYIELPHFYPFSEVNFNCTSKQMKGAVNQRVFDVPATASFIVTDWRDQLENLFEPGTEVICYHSPEEAEDLIRYYLDHPAERKKVVAAARRRVLAEHCYEHRMTKLISAMRNLYA